MSRRYIDPDIWTKLYGTKSSTKLVAVCLQASSQNPAGIFRIRPEEIAMKTGLKVNEVETGLRELNEREIVLWDQAETMVFIVGFAEVQGMNPKVARSITSELVRLGPSPLTVRASQIPSLRSQDTEGWDRLSIAYGEAMHTLQSVSLSEEGESEGETRDRRPRPKATVWIEDLLDHMRDSWPRGDGGKLYRFDRADSRRELKKLSPGNRPTINEVVAGVKRWSKSWNSNGFQHKASTFVRDRLWEQATDGKRLAKQITSKALIKGGD